jgi:hypothetical protein
MSPPALDEKALSTVIPSAEAHNVSYREGIGDLQVYRLAGPEDLKLDKDGITVLILQLSDDPNDPVSPL